MHFPESHSYTEGNITAREAALIDNYGIRKPVLVEEMTKTNQTGSVKLYAGVRACAGSNEIQEAFIALVDKDITATEEMFVAEIPYDAILELGDDDLTLGATRAVETLRHVQDYDIPRITATQSFALRLMSIRRGGGDAFRPGSFANSTPTAPRPTDIFKSKNL